MADAVSRSPSQDVREAARANAIDHYIAATLAPAEDRGDLVTWAAFVGEVQRIPMIASEALIGEIRLQWWVDVLASVHGDDGELTGNPVADAVRVLIRRRDLDLTMITGFVNARRAELYAEPGADGLTLDDYLKATDCAGFEIASQILNCPVDDEARVLFARAGEAYGLTRLMRHVLPAVAKGIWLLPRDGMWPSAMDGSGEEARGQAADAIAEISVRARACLNEIRAKGRGLERRQIAAILPVALVEPYLRVLQSTSHDPLRDVADIVPLQRVWRLWWAYRSQRV